MRPKLNHWCVIGFTDGAPIVALCVKVREEPEYNVGLFALPGKERVEDFDHTQVLAVLEPLRVPALPKRFASKRLSER